MGLLTCNGEPLTWEETKKMADYIKEQGITQFLRVYNVMKNRKGDPFKFGDELEYTLLHFDDEQRKVRLFLQGDKMCHELQRKAKEDPGSVTGDWKLESGRYMMEGLPKDPFEGLAGLAEVENNMILRREEVQRLLGENQRISSITTFPRLGCESFTLPEVEQNGPDGNQLTRSLFFPEEALSLHPRHRLMVKNIIKRRGTKTVANVPIFKDSKTSSPFVEEFCDEESIAAAKPDHIYMDSPGFGIGFSCIQVTIQAADIQEAKYLYDQLGPLCPIAMALSVGSPIFRGYLSDIDGRWSVISAGFDDRTGAERGEEPNNNKGSVVPDSRWDSIRYYLTNDGQCHNDVPFVVNKIVLERLEKEGVDKGIAQHIAHTYIRDPMFMFSKQLEENNDENDTYFSEVMQSMNFQSLRLKLPPPNTSIGWRVEFRVCDVQLTDFENAAFVVFIVLLSRVVLHYKLNLLVPISMIDSNMKEALKNDAARKSQFWFRRRIQTADTPRYSTSLFHQSADDISEEEYQKMSINTLINGKDGKFPGFIPLIKHYLSGMDNGVPATTMLRIEEHLELISKRAAGEYLTTAQWMRDFVLSHPEYKQDSVVSDSTNYDLLKRCDQISDGTIHDPKLFTRHQATSKIQKSIRLMQKEKKLV